MQRSDNLTDTETTDSDNKISPRHFLKNRFHLFFNQNGRHIMMTAEQLHGGLTNRSFLVRTLSSEYVVRIPGKGSEQYVDRAKESNDTNIAFNAGTTPAVVYDEKNGYKITYFLRAPLAMNSELLKNPHYIKQVAAVLKKLHSAGQPFANSIDVFERNRKMITILRSLPDSYRQIADRIDDIEKIIARIPIKKVPCHNDTTPGNFILSEGIMQIIDFEYGGNNDPAYDLSCLSIEAQFNKEQDEFLLQAYCGAEIDPSLKQRFILYKPVVEYWTGLWCRVQHDNANVLGRPNELKEMEEERIAHCISLLASEDIQREIESSKTMGSRAPIHLSHA